MTRFGQRIIKTLELILKERKTNKIHTIQYQWHQHGVKRKKEFQNLNDLYMHAVDYNFGSFISGLLRKWQTSFSIHVANLLARYDKIKKIICSRYAGQPKKA